MSTTLPTVARATDMTGIVQGVEGFMLTDLKLAEHNASMELVSGVTYGEFSEQYRARLNASLTEWANPVYDGVWSLALALNNSIPRLSDIGLDLVDYMYGHREATDIIRDEVFRLGFDGASGRIAYSNETGYAPAAAYLYQVVNHKYSYYSEDTQQLLLVQTLILLITLSSRWSWWYILPWQVFLCLLNPRRACAARVTVVVLCVCVSRPLICDSRN